MSGAGTVGELSLIFALREDSHVLPEIGSGKGCPKLDHVRDYDLKLMNQTALFRALRFSTCFSLGALC